MQMLGCTHNQAGVTGIEVDHPIFRGDCCAISLGMGMPFSAKCKRIALYRTVNASGGVVPNHHTV